VNVIMSDNDKRPRLQIPAGASVKDAAGGIDETLDFPAFLLLKENDEILVPAETELDIPAKGKVKASSGTSMKATSGTRTDHLTSVELVLPACTLSRPLVSADVELSAGTKAKTAGVEGSDPFVVLDSINFKGWV
jgi:hypothetical protein